MILATCASLTKQATLSPKMQAVAGHFILGMSAAQRHLRRCMCCVAQVTLSSTMGPGVPVLLPSMAQVVDASVVA